MEPPPPAEGEGSGMDSLPPRYQEPSASEGSDEDSLFGSQSNPPSSPEGRNGGEGEQPQPTVSNEPYGGLFGDDGDDEDDQDLPDDATTTGKANRKVGPAESYSTNVVQPPDPSTIKILKLSNMININKQAFNPLTHEPGPAVLVDDFGHRRINLHHLNTVRWRWVTDPSTGERTLQSNARFVRWEDGSMTLHIGEEVLSVAEVQDTAARRYMYVRVNKLMQLHPASLSSKLHRAIQMKSVQQSTKQVRVRTTAASVDKNRQEEEAKMRELHRSREQLKRKQKRERHKYSRPAGYHTTRTVRMPEFTEQYLDASDEEGDLEGAGGAGPRDRRGFDPREEEAAERRLTAAKGGDPWRVTKRRLDDDDEELSDDGEGAPEPAAKLVKRGAAIVSSDDE